MPRAGENEQTNLRWIGSRPVRPDGIDKVTGRPGSAPTWPCPGN